jgi:hypothetical protein
VVNLQTHKLLHNWVVQADWHGESSLPHKRKRDVFRASKAVKAAAREQIGSPQPTRVAPDRKKKQVREKHKTTLKRLLEQQN